MGCPTCDPLCGCLSLGFALRGLAIIKMVVVAFGLSVPLIRLMNPDVMILSRLFASRFALPFCVLVLLFEIAHFVLCVVILSILNRPPYRRLLLPIFVMSVLNILYGAALVVVCVDLKEAQVALIVHFALSALLALAMGLVTWGLLRRDKKTAGVLGAGNPQVPFNPTAYDAYGAPVYGQPSQTHSYNYVVVSSAGGVASPPQAAQQAEKGGGGGGAKEQL